MLSRVTASSLSPSFSGPTVLTIVARTSAVAATARIVSGALSFIVGTAAPALPVSSPNRPIPARPAAVPLTSERRVAAGRWSFWRSTSSKRSVLMSVMCGRARAGRDRITPRRSGRPPGPAATADYSPRRGAGDPLRPQRRRDARVVGHRAARPRPRPRARRDDARREPVGGAGDGGVAAAAGRDGAAHPLRPARHGALGRRRPPDHARGRGRRPRGRARRRGQRPRGRLRLLLRRPGGAG